MKTTLDERQTAELQRLLTAIDVLTKELLKCLKHQLVDKQGFNCSLNSVSRCIAAAKFVATMPEQYFAEKERRNKPSS